MGRPTIDNFTTTRWYHDPISHSCQYFPYTGLGGNSNNFPTKGHCELYCLLGGTGIVSGATVFLSLSLVKEGTSITFKPRNIAMTSALWIYVLLVRPFMECPGRLPLALLP
ncbi:Kunitz/Bovine pancreatic trypsin inhibitor domain protein [Necator americanus]|uniref:Kunitz/Bovine pancreatic trypsin inhibitor domain protein n=1 Tax=Necator americanus TaxID=51031 RepID=W2SWB3_NECAM|nr:Kunitz/Bovine pancreatic trypsin inhibitor domain protein [Necator americanus]ETN74049.1 Kunitz/Bovine pancreatic trypsin inhibitor domain protein [Necator americanus]